MARSCGLCLVRSCPPLTLAHLLQKLPTHRLDALLRPFCFLSPAHLRGKGARLRPQVAPLISKEGLLVPEPWFGTEEVLYELMMRGVGTSILPLQMSCRWGEEGVLVPGSFFFCTIVIEFGRGVHGAGITIAPPQLARQVGEEGVLVLEVPAGTPADKAGFKGTYRCVVSAALGLHFNRVCQRRWLH